MPLSGATTKEDYQRQLDLFSQTYVRYMNDSAAQYNSQFVLRVGSLEEDIKAAGLTNTGIEGCRSSNGNTFGMEHCAILIGNLAVKLPK